MRALGTRRYWLVLVAALTPIGWLYLLCSQH